MSEPETPIECPRHGQSHVTFVCTHVAGGTQQGFHSSSSNPSDPRPDAWCYACELRRAVEGEWNEANEAAPDVKVLCTACYDEVRARNDVPRPSLDIDGWELGTLSQALEASSDIAPPSDEVLRRISPGDVVKVVFGILYNDESGPRVQREWMWVRIRRNDDGWLVGDLESQPLTKGTLSPGQVVVCRYADVMERLAGEEAPALASPGPPRVRWVGGETARCSTCGKEHAWLEPSFWRPDDVFAMPAADRSARVFETDDICGIAPVSGAATGHRCFVRCVLPVRLLDRDDQTQWGLWVEVPEATAKRVTELWTASDQSSEPAFPARMANKE